MPELFKTTNYGTGRGSHYHVVYLNETTGEGMTTENMGHSHPVAFAVASEDGTAMSASVGWEIGPGGKDNHTHDIMPYVVEQKQKKEDESKVVAGVIDAYKSAKEVEKESLDLAKKCDEYYWGKQWADSDKRDLNAKARAANTFNMIGKNVDELCGHQRQARSNMAFLPTEDGDSVVCDILNILVKNIQENCNFDKEESSVFLDQGVTGRGNFNVYVDFSTNIRGDIVIECFPWDNVVYGAHLKEDLSDCEYLVKWKWYTKSKLEEMFPDKFKDIAPEDPEQEDTQSDIQPTKSESYSKGKTNDPDLVNYSKKEFKLLERWQKVYNRASIIARAEDDFAYNADGWKESDISALKALGFRVIPVVKTKIRITQVAGGVLLDDRNPADIEVDDFYMIPVYAKKRKGLFKGIVADAIDAQDEVNKRHSQSIDIGNKVAGYGHYYDSTTFPDDASKENFKRVHSSPGFLQEVTSVGKVPVREEGVKFPAEIVQLLQLGDEKLSAIMNIHPDPIGANDSGLALNLKTKMKLMGNEFLFDNLNFAKKKLGRLLVAMIQKYYSTDRIMRIIAKEATNNQSGEETMVGGKPLAEYDPEEIRKLLEEKDLTKYDITVSEAQWTPTMRIANLMVLLELAKTNPSVPPDVLIEFMDSMPKSIKDRLRQGIQQAQQAQSDNENKKMQMEIGKTLIAKGADPATALGGGQQMPAM